ncbi:MAG TPA: adenylate/guanylate cyclase domain-containing protein [Gaiellaceae bacterium]|nr:adenylate/guanylate cyclase domain-containing protein [Gaiellaceae bacterium]
MSAAPVRYARSGDVHVAYQVVGEGPIDLVMAMGAFTNLEVLWELPEYRRLCESLGSFARLIAFDKRGMGLSDRVHFGTLEERMDDIRAVMDAAGSETAALMGVSEGGPLSILFAATYPERTRALILAGAEVKEERTEDWPWGEAGREEFEAFMDPDTVVARWGKGTFLETFIPSRAGDETLRALLGRLQVQSATPRDAIAFMRMAFEIDVRDIVPAVKVPTLVLHRSGDRVCHVENGRFLARHIPGARYVELPGEDHSLWTEASDEIVAEIREFLTGVREPEAPDRVVSTVLFTDIVGSTGRARDLGDRRWRDLVDRHHELVRRDLARFRGREIDTAGDGFFATFDGPARGIRSAKAIVDSVRTLGLEIRAGLHTGEVELAGDAVRGIAVHTGARVAAQAAPGEVLVSQTVKDLVAGSGIDFEDRGTRELKGVPGEWRLYAVR